MGPFVLIVDDDEPIRTMLGELLRSAERDVVCAQDGIEALDCMKAERPDLVLLDLMMPGMSGWQVIEAMGESPRLSDVPVVVLTAFGERDNLPPMRPILHKPVDEEVLYDVVEDLLAQARNEG
jgi:CheY-like chemotaxis protein